MSTPQLEPEFHQALNEIYSTLKGSKLFQVDPELEKLLPVIQIPERVLQFRVVWEDDKGVMQVNTGYRVQFNSALGPYKGGLRFHPSVNLSILKFLGFEQTFKNALTGLMMGGGKGGSDFNPKGKSDNEIRKFCDSFMRELSRHIGPNTDVPAGDIGVGGREVGYLFGAYKKYRNAFEGILTGKGITWGGSLIRPEATGYGLIYYVNEMLTYGFKDTIKGKVVAISGSGNVAQYAALKVIELGGIVVSLSDSKGTLIAKDLTKGFAAGHLSEIGAIKLKFGTLESLASSSQSFKGEFDYHAGKRPWLLFEKLDIALPCATQNEVSKEEAQGLLKAGVKIAAEGSNMGSTQEAIDVFEASRTEKAEGGGIWYAPGKASNCGGVAVSGLEMAQNSQRISWTREEVDSKLEGIMKSCFDICVQTALKYTDTPQGSLPSLVAGANIGGFIKVADAMKAQGDWW